MLGYSMIKVFFHSINFLAAYDECNIDEATRLASIFAQVFEFLPIEVGVYYIASRSDCAVGKKITLTVDPSVPFTQEGDLYEPNSAIGFVDTANYTLVANTKNNRIEVYEENQYRSTFGSPFV